MTSNFDVVGIGNAIVDVLAKTQDAFLRKHGLTKGTMTIIDAEMAETLYEQMGPATKISGGSAANTIAALASLGSKTAFIGKVRNDELGDLFRQDIRAMGVYFVTDPKADGPPTARSFILVTPDAERTMQTFLGSCVELGPEDIDPVLIARSSVTYLEGYLWDPPQAKKAFVKAAKIAMQAGKTVSLSLSDPFCVKRHRIEFVSFVNNHVSLLFANEEEIKSLYRVKTFDEAVQKVRGQCKIAVLTRGEKGSVVITEEKTHVLDAKRVKKVVDTTGAGDAYAAGFLYGYTRGKDLSTCARLAGGTASEIIRHYGARPKMDLSKLLEETLDC